VKLLRTFPAEGGSPDVRHDHSEPRARLSAEQAERVESFLGEFLPRLKQESAVIEILHGGSPDGRDITRSSSGKARMTQSVTARARSSKNRWPLEQELGLASTREAFAVSQHLS
jgi:hypothetical protein